jgi:CheY-like chemotaxis protein
MTKKVLIVEDYEDTRDFMKFLLEGYGYKVSAVESVKQEFPDLILMDMSMPEMDGLTATKIIRQFDGTAKLPIIAVTAHGKSYYRKAIEAGCDDLINKPLDFNVLDSILHQYLAP